MKTFKSFRIKLEMIDGTFIEQIAAEAIELANLLDAGVDFEYNGMCLFVSPTNTEEEICYAYYQWTKQSSRKCPKCQTVFLRKE